MQEQKGASLFWCEKNDWQKVNDAHRDTELKKPQQRIQIHLRE
jgi:hypothetical protein